MGFWEAVQWWQEWQLRILVLTSLFLQCFLSLAAMLRKSCIPSWLRFIIWLAYLSSDAVAIYGLATLFNRQRTQEWVSTHQSSASPQVLWAPILLIHLGGQNNITAYNIEDNELWRRHVLTAVSQVTVAVYVFGKSCPEDKTVLVTGVLLFVVGILKCLLKPWDLKRVSINSLVDSSAGSEENSNVSSLDEYIQAATENFREGSPSQQLGNEQGEQGDDEDKKWKAYDLFIDLSTPYSDRLSCLKVMVHCNLDNANALVRHVLSMTFDRLYTKKTLLFPSMLRNRDGTTKSLSWATFLRLAANIASIVSIQLGFRLRYREAYDHTDVKITLTLIRLAFVVDYLFPSWINIIDKIIGKHEKGRWPDGVAQYNIMGYLARNKKHRNIRRLATLLVCKDYIDQLWYMKPSKSSCEITKLVNGYIAQAWMQHYIKDMATYRAFNDNRGQWILKQEGCNRNLDWGLGRPFDESVLLWHLATNFCLLHMDPSRAHNAAYEAAYRSKEISNYMVYLLFVNPEMLMTGARRSLFKAMYKELKGIPLNDESAPQSEKKFAQNIMHKIMTTDQGSGMFHDAWTIANELITGFHRDQEKVWRVVQGVWVEMLCFSVGRCRGYLHAKSLGKGGEFLFYIWLLLFYMGMETVSEKMQRSELQENTYEDV